MLPSHVGDLQQDLTDTSAMQSYPPAAAGRVNGTSHKHDSGNSLQDRLLGPRGITACTVQAQTQLDGINGKASLPANIAASVKAPRWHTLEFRFYALVFVVVVPIMCWVPIRLSSYSSPQFPRYSQHLERGWMFGRLRDDSDFQYKSFRDYVGVLVVVMAVYIGLSKISEGLGSGKASYQAVSSSIERRRPNRFAFLSIFTAIFVLALHGCNTVKLLAACSVNFAITTTLGGTIFATPAIWTWNVALLYAVHYYEGFPIEPLAPQLAFMDKYTGLLPRWQINFNISMLRLVSYALDYHWARKEAQLRSLDEQSSIDMLNPRQRTDMPVSLHDYTFGNYLLYALYPPLFIAGPIMTFNDFYRQLRSPLPVSQRYTLLYGMRWLFSFLSMEFILHFMYMNAIKDAKAWRGATPMELSMIGFWNLIIVWLKLLIPWRFFRLWALADGVDAPENMIRCMANNYSTLGFWRSWHRSYNLWIVRYIYVPVGGAKNVVPATLLVFTFVALWHDLSLKLLTWGWLVTLFILPEVLARNILGKKGLEKYAWFRHVCAIGGVLNVLMMMTANLIGFAIGMDGMKYMWQQLLSSIDGIAFMFTACGVLFVGVQVMFEYRGEELRRGIDRKC